MRRKEVDIETGSGRMRTFVFHPERDGPHPIVIFLMDALGIRQELFDMAQRLAAPGYYVVMPNLYYRSNVLDVGPHPAPDDKVNIARITGYLEQLTIPRVLDDLDAVLKFADSQPAAALGPVGCLGYCMSGRFAVGMAARHPERVAAAASIYGTSLMTDAPDSPHLLAERAKGELYLCFAESDDWTPLSTVAAISDHLAKSDANVEVEIYRGKVHGFTFPSRHCYDPDATEQHWERLYSLFGRRLRRG
jgi:carboxymethylenebutenolidase